MKIKTNKHKKYNDHNNDVFLSLSLKATTWYPANRDYFRSGSVLPPLQASIIDMHTVFGMPSTNVSFILPFICFVVIAIYGFRTKLRSIGKLLG